MEPSVYELQRLLSHIDKAHPSGCWVWKASIRPNGYGQVRVEGKNLKAHRYVWERLVGQIPKGMDLDHVCHNRACVNPEHLRLATRAENLHNLIWNPRNTSGFKGVHYRKDTKRWSACIRVDGRQVYLGCFGNPAEAHEAYCRAADKYNGEFANHGVRPQNA